jgi:hypothetical protein
MLLADNPKKRDEFGNNARNLAEKEFARDKLGTLFVNYIEEVTKIQ